MGIGLSIVDAIAVAHGGTVAVESAPGQGATFVVTIPTGTDGAPSDDVEDAGDPDAPVPPSASATSSARSAPSAPSADHRMEPHVEEPLP